MKMVAQNCIQNTAYIHRFVCLRYSAWCLTVYIKEAHANLASNALMCNCPVAYNLNTKF